MRDDDVTDGRCSFTQRRAINPNSPHPTHPPTPTRGRSHAATHLPVPQVDHGLDGKDVPGLHRPLGLVLGVVRHGGVGVEELPDAVPAVGAHDGAARGIGDLFVFFVC